MRTRSTRLTLRLLCSALLALAAACPAMAQDDDPPLWSGAEGAGQALGGLFEKCDAAMTNDGIVGYANGTMSLAVARVIPGPTATIDFWAEGGLMYSVYAAGDENAADGVTVEIQDENGEVISGHPDDDTTIASFGREQSANVRIAVSIPYAEDGPAAYIAVAVLCDGGERAESGEFAHAFGQLIAAAGAAEAETGTELKAHGNDQFAIYGAVLPPNQGGHASGVTLEPNPHILLCAGDEKTTTVSCDFSDGGVESYGYSGEMDGVAAVAYTPTELTSVAPSAGGNGERCVLVWMLLDVEPRG